MASQEQTYHIRSLAMNGQPLASCIATFQVGAVPVCTVVPVTGISPSGGSYGAGWINEVEYGDPAIVELSGSTGTFILFTGRVSGITTQASPGILGGDGAAITTITLTHNLGDLEALSFGVREFIYDGTTRKRLSNPVLDNHLGAVTLRDIMRTQALVERKPAKHITELLQMFSDWYQNSPTGAAINVRTVLKACDVVARDFGSLPALQEGILEASEQAVGSGLSSGATVLALARVIADFCMLTIVPRLEDGIIVPNVPVIKHHGDAAFGSRYVTEVQREVHIPVLPTTRVCVHAVRPLLFLAEQMAVDTKYQINPQQDSHLPGYYYPVLDGSKVDSVLVSSAPAILRKMLDKSLYRENTEASGRPSETSTVTGNMPSADTRATADRSGDRPATQALTESKLIGEAAARGIYCARAYSECRSGLMLVPGYVFGGGLNRDMRTAFHGWEDGSIWSLLGKVVKFQTPYSQRGALVRQELVGYVNQMSVEIVRSVPSASVRIGFTHVRSVKEDDKHSILTNDHPIFTAVTGLKAE